MPTDPEPAYVPRPSMTDLAPRYAALAAMMPEGWYFEVGHYRTKWIASASPCDTIGPQFNGEGPTEIEARLRLIHSIYSHLSATPGEKR